MTRLHHSCQQEAIGFTIAPHHNAVVFYFKTSHAIALGDWGHDRMIDCRNIGEMSQRAESSCRLPLCGMIVGIKILMITWHSKFVIDRHGQKIPPNILPRRFQRLFSNIAGIISQITSAKLDLAKPTVWATVSNNRNVVSSLDQIHSRHIPKSSASTHHNIPRLATFISNDLR